MRTYLPAFIFSLFFPLSASAQVSVSDDFFSTNPGGFSFNEIGPLISVILPNVIIFAGVLLLLLIIYAGYQLITLGGQSNSPAQVAKSRSMITYALIGFLLVVSAYFILQIIGVATGVNY